MKRLLLLLSILLSFGSASAQTDYLAGKTSPQVKTFLSLNNVENTALSTWAGSSNITTVGTLTSLTVGSSTGLVTWSSGALSNNTLAANAILFASSTSAVTGNSTNLTYTSTAGILDRISDAGTNAVVDILTTTHNSNGSIVAGFGVGHLFNGQSTTTADRNMGEINAQWTTATDASRVAKFVFQLANNPSLATAATILSTGIIDMPIGFRINGAASAGKILIGDGTNFIASTPTYPNASASSGKILISDGTNFVSSTPTYPNSSASSRKILVSDGTNFVASTETWAVPGTSGNILQSDGTNWTSVANTGGGYTYSTITGDATGTAGNFYWANKAGSRLVLTLPTSPTIGQHIALAVDPSQGTGWKLAQPATTKMIWGSATTTAGTGGYIQSTSTGDAIDVVFQKNDGTNNLWYVVAAQGQLTVN